MCRGLDFQIETNAVSKNACSLCCECIGMNTNVIARNWQMKSDLKELSTFSVSWREPGGGSSFLTHTFYTRALFTTQEPGFSTPVVILWDNVAPPIGRGECVRHHAYSH